MCENWVKLTGSKATIDAIADKAFMLEAHFPAPKELTDEEHYTYLYEQFSTKWIADEDGIGPAQVRRVVGDNTLTVLFTSAWSPPYGFYKLLVGQYPDLHIDYEYHCWESGFIGHGQMHKDDLSDPARGKTDAVHFSPNHCRYDTLAELNAFIEGREWTVDTGNPQLEYYEGDRSKFVSVD